MGKEHGLERKIAPVTEQYSAAFGKVNWTLHARNTIYDKPWMQIHLDDYKKADGRTDAKEFVTVRSPDYVDILPIDPKNGMIVLVCEYARGKGAPHIKLPGGKIGPQQSPEEAAQAELLQETGHEGKIIRMTSKYGVPMWYDAIAHFAFAEVDSDSFTEQLLDKHEEIYVIHAPIGEIVEMVLDDDPAMDDLELSFAVYDALAHGIIPEKFLESSTDHSDSESTHHGNV